MNKTIMSYAVKKFCIGILLFLFISIIAGCTFTLEDNVELEDKELNEDLQEEQVIEEKEVSVDEIIETYKPDELGDIPVIMYHAVCENPPSVYQRSVEGFKEDLLYMYEHNFRTISCTDYVNYNINVEAGMTPIVLTFDDGDYRSFALMRDENGNLVPEEDCAIDLMEKFYKEHNDFGKNAILFINGHNSTFLGKDKTITLEERINWLLDNGYEVSNHTDTHINLKSASINDIMKNLGKVDQLIKGIRSDVKLEAIAYPFGAKPSSENGKYVLNGTYNEIEYSYKVGFREGPSKARFYPVIHIDFEPLNAPRLRGNKGEVGDMHSYFESYEKNPSLRYVSDGNPNRIVIPKNKESKINKELEIIKDMEIVTY